MCCEITFFGIRLFGTSPPKPNNPQGLDMCGELPQAVHEEFEESESASAENSRWVPTRTGHDVTREKSRGRLFGIRKAKEEI